MTQVALDTSAAVPLLLRRHADHEAVRAALDGYSLCLTGHSQAETYSVLTRLPGDARLHPGDAVRLLSAGFDPPRQVDRATLDDLPSILAASDIAGGAVYDALVGLATLGSGTRLITRDRRAAATYSALGVEYELV